MTTTLMGANRWSADARRLIDVYAQALCADGLPIERIFVVVPTLHPQTLALSIVWNSDGRPVQEIARQWSLGPEFLASPLARIADGSHAVIRRRLLDRSTPRDFAVLRDLDEQGCTDYLLTAIRGARPRRRRSSWRRRRDPRGRLLHGPARFHIAVRSPAARRAP